MNFFSQNLSLFVKSFKNRDCSGFDWRCKKMRDKRILREAGGEIWNLTRLFTKGCRCRIYIVDIIK